MKVLEEVAKRSGWGTPLPAGVGRGIAIVESFGTIVAEVVEASLKEDGTPKVHKVWAAVDCGTTVNPLNAEAQIQGKVVLHVLVGKDGGECVTGTPFVTGARVVGVVAGEVRGDKIRIFKKKRRKQYRRTAGHRSLLTRVRITEIQA